MRLYEYEGKQLYREAGLAVPLGLETEDPAGAAEAAKALKGPVMIKAQLLKGGRGKAGLVLTAETPEEAVEKATTILEKLEQGEKLLVEQRVDADMESYVGITVDDINGDAVMVVNKQGGINVEAISESSKPATLEFNLLDGIQLYDIMNLVKKAGFEGGLMVSVAKLLHQLYQAFLKYDADTVEINPVLISTEKNMVWAADSKVVIDDYSLFRQPQVQAFRMARMAAGDIDADRLVFIDLGGNIGVISVGASNTMMLVDSIKYMGGEPANFLDVTGSANYEYMVELYIELMEKFNRNDNLKAIFINFTLVAQLLENYAGAVAEAMKRVPARVPVIACIRAVDAAVTNMSLEEANSLLEAAGAATYTSLEEAVNEAVRLSRA